jgi:hypothetical protein
MSKAWAGLILMGKNFSLRLRVTSRATLVKSLMQSSQVVKTAVAADIARSKAV